MYNIIQNLSQKVYTIVEWALLTKDTKKTLTIAIVQQTTSNLKHLREYRIEAWANHKLNSAVELYK